MHDPVDGGWPASASTGIAGAWIVNSSSAVIESGI